jgi:hypothetical protein
MRAPVDTIPAPPFLTHLKWVNVATLRMDKQRGHPVLIEFWDSCRPNSLRTLPYLKAWHERYSSPSASSTRPPSAQSPSASTPSPPALRVVGIHSPGFEIVREREDVSEAAARLGVEYPVLVDPDLEMWQEYENRGWPARYLFDGRGMLAHYHYGEGAYRETELAIQELLGVEREPLRPLRPEDLEGAVLARPSEQREGAYSGPYEAGGVWAVLDGKGAVRVNGGPEIAVTHPGAYPLIEHERHTAGVLDLDIGAGVRCLATCFTPGLA